MVDRLQIELPFLQNLNAPPVITIRHYNSRLQQEWRIDRQAICFRLSQATATVIDKKSHYQYIRTVKYIQLFHTNYLGQKGLGTFSLCLYNQEGVHKNIECTPSLRSYRELKRVITPLRPVRS